MRAKLLRATRPLGYLLVLFLFALSDKTSAAVTIVTTDGRVIAGEVDAQSDQQRLWIRQADEGIQLTTSIAWPKVAAAFEGEQDLSLDNLPEVLLAQATDEPQGFLLQQTIYETPIECEGGCPPESASIARKRLPKPKVRSLDVDAYLVNLDRDVEPDGLELVIAALDEHGLPMPVKGSLSIRLWGERIQPHGSLVRYEDLQQWSQRVEPADFVDGVARYPLRFRTVNPEFDLGLHSDALVNVRLGVFGQGNYEASVPVQIRAFNPVRDRLQLTTGGRFFPNELTQEVRHQLPRRTHTRSLRNR